jgi:hypothetical protein
VEGCISIDQTDDLQRITLFSKMQDATNRIFGWRAKVISCHSYSRAGTKHAEETVVTNHKMLLQHGNNCAAPGDPLETRDFSNSTIGCSSAAALSGTCK